MSADTGARDRAEISRSAIEADKNPLSPTYIARYLNPPADTAFPLEYAFYLLGNVQDKRVLDLGCGTGEIIPALVELGAEVTGIDISPDLIRLAQQRIQGKGFPATLRLGSAYETGLGTQSIDVVFCMSLLHHLDIPLAMREMQRILKPDGFIIIKEPIAFSSVYQKIRSLFPRSEETSEYEHPLTKEEFLDLTKDFLLSDLRFFRLPFAAIFRILGARPKRFMLASDFLLRQWPRLERWATVAVMKLQTK